MSLRRGIVALSLAVAMLVPGTAGAWKADFFEYDASGSATYEEMVIQPQAVYDPAMLKTHIIFQGYGMHPYAVSYDHTSATWAGPYQIGDNPLGQDMHGGPSVVIDAAGHVVVFFGGHLGQLSQARSTRPGDVSEWEDLGPVKVGSSDTTLAATYPQATLDADGRIRLYYRRDNNDANRGDWETIVTTPTPAGGIAWVEPERVLDGSIYRSTEPTTSGTYWYANLDHDTERGPALAAVRRDMAQSQSDFYIRKGVYYLERSSEVTWTSAAGEELLPPRGLPSLEVTAAVRPEGDGYYTNQVVVRRDAEGVPGILYLCGTHADGVYEWRFARWDDGAWQDVLITTTDNFFDSGTFEFMRDGSIEAFLTTGDALDDQWRDDPATVLNEALSATRGGDITMWRSADGADWTKVRDIITSPGPHARYNNPQIVSGYRDGVRLIFSEWNNDAANFMQKVFLWGDDGFKQRVLVPAVTRLAGDSRITTAIEISRQGFPLGATTAVLAAAHDFPDVLCGVPLAHALKAPVLLTRQGELDPEVAEELLRLNVNKVIILGGESAVSSHVAFQVGKLINSRGWKVRAERIAGANRYETSAAIARKLVEVRGLPSRVMLASGATFADALSVSPYAARRGYPIILTPATQPNPASEAVIKELIPREMIVVGGEAAVSTTVTAAYETAAWLAPSDRWGGADRYETAAIVARHATDAGHSLERFALATGENFADAVGGGLLMARVNGVVLTTRSTSLAPAVTNLLAERGFGPGTGVLRVYVLGGPVAVAPEVVDSLAARLLELDAASQP